WTSVGDHNRQLRIVRMHRLVQDVIRRSGEHATAKLEEALFSHLKTRADFLWESWIEPDHRWEIGPLAAAVELCLRHRQADGVYLANQMSQPLSALGRLAEARTLLQSAIRVEEGYGA